MWGPDEWHLDDLTGNQPVLSSVSMRAPHGSAQMKQLHEHCSVSILQSAEHKTEDALQFIR